MGKPIQETPKIKVCVIGAGAAGLCAARHLARQPDQFEFKVYEKASIVGGTWFYTDKVGIDDNGLPLHTSMYKNLSTNLPKEIMCFPDYREIKGGNKSCVSHAAILDYLEKYAEHFDLKRHIQFHTIVECVKVEKEATAEKWKVRIKSLKSSQSEDLVFDAIMVCNGHYFDPYIPNIPGLDSFHGQKMHSHDYRVADDFSGKTIILLGASSSGIDIAIESLEKAAHVYLSHNDGRLFKDHLDKFTEVQGIHRYENEHFVLKDGTEVQADVLMFCTGYHFSYPFLDNNCDIKVDENYVSPLYKHLLNVEHPSMCFIGIPMIVVPFPMFHIQVQYFLSVLQHKASLPEKSIMLENSKLKTLLKRHAHKFGSLQWSYNDELAKAAGVELLPSFYKLGYEIWSEQRKRDLKGYKRFNLGISTDGKTVEIKDL